MKRTILNACGQVTQLIRPLFALKRTGPELNREVWGDLNGWYAHLLGAELRIIQALGLLKSAFFGSAGSFGPGVQE